MLYCAKLLEVFRELAMSQRDIVLDGGPPWGFRIHGGVDQNQPLRIARVSYTDLNNYMFLCGVNKITDYFRRALGIYSLAVFLGQLNVEPTCIRVLLLIPHFKLPHLSYRRIKS